MVIDQGLFITLFNDNDRIHTVNIKFYGDILTPKLTVFTCSFVSNMVNV